jgi:tetratricopeptide (TPR) repeat protein
LLREKGGLLSMHRLMQEVVREGHRLAEDTQWISCCLDMVCAVFKYEWGHRQSMAAFTLNVPHVLTIAGYAEATLDVDEEAQKKVAWLYHEAGWGFNYGGQYVEALEWYQKALAIDEIVLGKEHPSTATTYNNIATVYHNQGDYTKALEWYQKALAIQEKVLGKEHPDTATTYNGIAFVYHSQGDYTMALEWYQER